TRALRSIGILERDVVHLMTPVQPSEDFEGPDLTALRRRMQEVRFDPEDLQAGVPGPADSGGMLTAPRPPRSPATAPAPPRASGRSPRVRVSRPPGPTPPPPRGG